MLGFENLDLTKIKSLCKEMQVEYQVVRTDIAQIIFEDRKETNPCSLCAKMRKGALNEEKFMAKRGERVQHGTQLNDILLVLRIMIVVAGHISGPNGTDCDTSFNVYE